MFLWLYLFFFNMLWVVFPLWVLYAGYGKIVNAVDGRATVTVEQTSVSGGGERQELKSRKGGKPGL